MRAHRGDVLVIIEPWWITSDFAAHHCNSWCNLKRDGDTSIALLAQRDDRDGKDNPNKHLQPMSGCFCLIASDNVPHVLAPS